MARNFKTTADSFLTKAPEVVSVEEVKVPKGYILKPLPKSERMHCLVNIETKTALREIATRKNMSVNALVNEIFDEYISSHT